MSYEAELLIQGFTVDSRILDKKAVDESKPKCSPFYEGHIVN